MRAALALFAALAAAAPAVAEDSASCAFTAGALPAATLPAGAPHGAQIPIETIVVLMQENRSFDHYFGRLHRMGQRRAEGEPITASNPDPTGGATPIGPFHQTEACEVADLDHSWNGTHRSWNGGAMDGFTAVNVDPADATGSRTMGYHTRKELPFYYRLYRDWAIGDRFFSALLSQTFPNRLYLLAGTSFGHIRNDFPPLADDFAQRSIFNLLDEAGVSWKVYYSDLPVALLFGYVRNTRRANVVPIASFFTDAQSGMLPQVAFVDPKFVGARNVENDEHPPANIQVGQRLVYDLISVVGRSPQWPHAAIFLTYDEHGGYYDHVPPPPACVPDAIPPLLESGDVPGAFDRYGIRVPAVVVSPYARRRFVSHTVHDHTSILRFIETRFDLPALTRRDANADPMLELFDFAHQRTKPPRLGKAPALDATLAAHCDALPAVTEQGP
ncbi:MAG: alkaline phosphatase family protein [Candidatus Binatia bacterium]